MCKRLDLFGAELIAIDGSKLHAVNNKQRNYTSKKLKTLIKRIDEKIEAYFKDCEEYDEEEASVKKVDREELNQKIKQMQDRKDKYKSLRNELEESGESQISLSDPESRRVTRWIHEDILEEMQERVEQNKLSMKKRKCIVEHPFGTIKRWMNQGYFLTRGLEKVKTEFRLTVMAYKMKRAMTIIGVLVFTQSRELLCGPLTLGENTCGYW